MRTTDTAALTVARTALRQAYYQIRSIRGDEPAIRCILHDLDEMCCDLTTEIQAVEPELPMRVSGAAYTP